jgi:NADH:ubiquinone oxidoreductase subunit 5 (subunit L)/multisubunit Na+/H+ antiporter MnhA subunit
MGGQDSRRFGCDRFSFGTFLCFFVRRACLMGFPFYIGFYSKDFIILSSSVSLGLFYYFTFLSGCLLTVCYRGRLLKASFSGVLTNLVGISYRDDKVFLVSVCFLFMKSWILGMFFFCLFFFDAGVVFLGYDLIVGLILIRLAGFAKIRLGYTYQGFVYSIGYLRWLVVSQSRLNNKVYL